MTPSQLNRRAALLARHDAALERWPQGQSPEFIREVTAIADDLAQTIHERAVNIPGLLEAPIPQ